MPTIIHISPYLRPDTGRWNGTTNVLSQLGLTTDSLTHNVVVCGAAPETTQLNERTTLWVVPVPNVECHAATSLILRHSECFANSFPMPLREELRVCPDNHRILAHGPEALLFVEQLSRHFRLPHATLGLQTHYGIWDICALAESDSGWHTYGPCLTDLHLRAKACLAALAHVGSVWVENSCMSKSLTANTRDRLREPTVAPLVSSPPVVPIAAGRSRRKKILVAGRCAYEKNFDTAIRAFDIAHQRHRHMRHFSLDCIVMSRLPYPYPEHTRYLEMLHTLAQTALSRNAIRLRPALNHRNLLHEIATCSLLLVPSRYEPFGIIALEGILHGTKTVVTPCVGAREHISSPLLRISDGCSPESIAEAMAEHIANGARQCHQISWPSVDEQLELRHGA